MTSKHLQLWYWVRFSHGIDETVITNLKFDLLESPWHCCAGSSPLTVDVNYGQSSLKHMFKMFNDCTKVLTNNDNNHYDKSFGVVFFLNIKPVSYRVLPNLVLCGHLTHWHCCLISWTLRWGYNIKIVNSYRLSGLDRRQTNCQYINISLLLSVYSSVYCLKQ